MTQPIEDIPTNVIFIDKYGRDQVTGQQILTIDNTGQLSSQVAIAIVINSKGNSE